MNMIKFHQNVYYCEVSSLSIMGTHYHLNMKFLPFKEVTIAALKKRALLLHTNTEKQLDNLTEEKWITFRKQLFNRSEFMRNVQSGFAR